MKTGDNVKEHPQRLELRERIIDTALKSFATHGIKSITRGSRNLVGIIVSYSHPKFRPLPHGNKSIGGVGSHRASL